MEWIAALQGKVVGLDTAPLIYFIEENPTYLETVCPLVEAMDHGEFSVVTSVVTLLEVLVHPFRNGDTQLARQYRDILLNAEGLTTPSCSPRTSPKMPHDYGRLIISARRMPFR